MFSYLKSKQKSISGFKNPGFKNLVQLNHNDKTIEIYGEEHNTAMIKNNIYTKIIKTLKNDSDYKKPLILVEHSDHPFLCSLSEDEIPKFQDIIKTSGSELVFFELINDPINKRHIKCVDNRITLGYLPAKKEMEYSNMIYQFMQIKLDTLPFKLEQILEHLKHIIYVYQDQIQILKDNEYHYKDTILEALYLHYVEILELHFSIILNILIKSNLLHTNLSDVISIPETSNYTILMRVLNVFIENFIKISSLSVDINIFNIIKEQTEYKNILLFCGNNHCIRLTKLFFKGIEYQLYNEKSDPIDNFSLEDLEKADIKPIFSIEKDLMLIKYLESISENQIDNQIEKENISNMILYNKHNKFKSENESELKSTPQSKNKM